jgi:WD40 repeat protein
LVPACGGKQEMATAAREQPAVDESGASRHLGDYDGFISYSHAVDGRLAPTLQSALQRFAKPWYRLRAVRVFRDEASLSADPGLWSAIESALERSQWFLLLASPTAAASPWVAREAQFWLKNKRLDHLLVVLTEGELGWDSKRSAFDPAATTAMPEPLLGAFREEPRFVDLRWARTREHLSLRDPRFRGAVADLAAPLRGQAKDELIGEEVRQHRRAVRLARGAVTVLVALVVAATASAVLAVRGQSAARAERDRAEEQASIATSRQLAAESDAALRESHVDEALLLAAHSYRIRATAEARDALLAALHAVPRLETILHPGGSTPTAMSADGRLLVSRTAGNVLEVRRLTESPVLSGAIRRVPVRGEIVAVEVSPDGTVAATGDRTGAVTLHDLTGSAEPRRFPGLSRPPGEEGPFQATSLALTRGGKLVSWNGARINVWNGRKLTTLTPGVKPYQWLLTFSRDGRRLAAGSDADGTVVIWRMRLDGSPRGDPTVFRAGSGEAPTGWGPSLASLAFSPTNPRLLAVGGWDGTVAFWDTDSGVLLARERAGVGAVGKLVFTSDGRRLASTDEGGIRIWNVGRRAAVLSLPAYGFTGLRFLDSHRLAAAGPRGLAIWDVDGSPTPLALRLRAPDTGTTGFAYDPSGKLFATIGDEGVRLWDASSLHPVGKPLPNGWQTVDLAFSPDGTTIAAWPSDRAPLALWSLQGKREDVRGLGWVADVAFTNSGAPIAASWDRSPGEGDIALWDVRSRRRLGTLDESAGAGGPFALSPGARVAAGSIDEGQTLRLWNAATGRVLSRELAGGSPAALAFSRDGRLLASSSWNDSTIRIWDAATGGPVTRLLGERPSDALAFNSNGTLLAAATFEFVAGAETRAFQLWDVTRGELLGSRDLVAGSGQGFNDVAKLAFAPSGDALAVLGLGATPLILDLKPSSWQAIACRVAGRDLTRVEWAGYVGDAHPYERVCA